MTQLDKNSAEYRRRRRERITVVVLFVFLMAFTAVEIHLLKTSAQLPFVNSIFFFGLMNLNIILIMVLLFLIFRNVVKLVLDERRRKRGASLKARLVFCFVLFAIVPTVLLFSISAFYIRSSFDKWFNVRVEGALQRSIEVAKNYYEGTQNRAQHFARKIALSISENDPKDLGEFLQVSRLEFGLDALELYQDPFSPRLISSHPERFRYVPNVPLKTLEHLFSGHSDCSIQDVGGGELVRCGAYLGVGKGVIFASYFIPMNLKSQMAGIALTYKDYKEHSPINYPIKSTYFAILLMVTLLILFTATWTGFYVARRLSVPIEELVRGTSEVAKGNLDYHIPSKGNDELNQLIESFNQMTSELRDNKIRLETTHSHLKQMNTELVHRRRYIEVLLESVQSGVISLDEKGIISTVNRAVSKLLRLSESELVGKPYWTLIPEAHRGEFSDLLSLVNKTGKSVRREIKFRYPNEGLLTMVLTMNVLQGTERAHTGVVVVLEDVTDIQKMERMAAWREVARRIAHEIKNPLTPIQLSVERLRRRYLTVINDDGTFDEATKIVLTEVNALKSLVNEFSAYARLPEIKPEPEDLGKVVLEAVNLFRAAHETITFELNIEESLPKMTVDRDQLKRVLINLFDNAVDAMNGKGRIQVSALRDPASGVVQLVVSDEGYGIDEAVYSQLFEPYFSTKENGTGLGLAIVHRIISDHGGTVHVEANETQGTRFTVEFPESLFLSRSEGFAGPRAVT